MLLNEKTLTPEGVETTFACHLLFGTCVFYLWRVVARGLVERVGVKILKHVGRLIKQASTSARALRNAARGVSGRLSAWPRVRLRV